MSKNKVLQPNFKLSFLLPKYWLTWIGVLIMYSISWLPYKFQIFLGRQLGKLLFKIGSSRKKVAARNIELCFPEMPETEREELLRKNFESTGIALLETGMGWWWPDWRIKRKFTVTGLEHIEKAKADGHHVFILAMHYLCAEIIGRGFGHSHPLVIFYRPHNNQLMEFFQFRGRGRSNKYMLGKKDVKGLIKAIRTGESSLYLPDQDYGRNRSVFVPFFDVKETATTTGTLIFARQPKTKTFMLIPQRKDDGSGYTVEITPALDNFPSEDDIEDTTRINQEVEKVILRKPEQYMWLHRRFKTRPNENDASLYK
ncbi:LpxL/LpxP family Kdo(2)-lipid IV(A) lauroyl/palmitoleoyl acyltransferase [Pseudocolwellia agarivorans]|uniref:LpxL/LpxP family Kdo(2)-lipid IV(A) lauroyl/palmitoleoyl acyltransferase n=1 Tax=Pseudocolwellia agarivorans TaxID=1911682 RepID=UPI003F885ED3